MTDVLIPTMAIVGDSVWLNCSYDLEDNQLYSIKWYKDQEEIYRFLPTADTPKTKYEASGLNLQVSRCIWMDVVMPID